MFNQGSMELNDYREKYNNIVQIVSSYDIELFERKDLHNKCCVMFPAEMSGNYLEEFEPDYPEKFELVKQTLTNETAALAFIANPRNLPMVIS